jgi:hypothetical protein
MRGRGRSRNRRHFHVSKNTVTGFAVPRRGFCAAWTAFPVTAFFAPALVLLHGFNSGGDPKQFFPPILADKVAVGFLTGDTTPAIVSQAMDYLITDKAAAGTKYKLREPRGYPGMIGAMFWTIDADRRGNYNFSNAVGTQLHSYPASKQASR